MLLKTYKFCDYKINKFEYENLNDVTGKNESITLNIRTNISANLPDNIKKDNGIDCIIEIEHTLSNREDTFKLVLNILNFVCLEIDKDIDKDVEISEIIEKNCLPDLLKKSREKIKELSSILNIYTIELPPFNLEKK